MHLSLEQHQINMGFTRVESVSMWSRTYLELLQSTRDERLTRCLFPAESEHVLHGLLKGLSLSNQMSRLHHDQEHVLHLKKRVCIALRVKSLFNHFQLKPVYLKTVKISPFQVYINLTEDTWTSEGLIEIN